MKQETKQTDSKEVLQSDELIKEYNARQELYLGNGSALKSYIFATNDETGLKITVESEYREDNFYHLPFAKLIIEAVNERQKLLDSNRELLVALETMKMLCECDIQDHKNGLRPNDGYAAVRLRDVILPAINKAKTYNHD